MKKFFLLSVAATLISSLSFATIRRVGYFGPAVAGVDYPNFQAAHDASIAGDTIMMHPGSKFGTADMTKKLVVIGPGYFLGQNANLQANNIGMDSTSSGTMTLSNATVNGSNFIGCTFSPDAIRIIGIGIENISFLRCWFLGSSSSVTTGIDIRANINNFLFQQCAFKERGLVAVNVGGVICTNLAFINCLFYTLQGSGSNWGIYLSSGANSGIVQNCIFNKDPSSNLYAFLYGIWSFNNSIANDIIIAGTGINYQNCIGTNNLFPSGNGNLQNQTWANIFTLTGSTDAQYTLKAGSPAIGAGIGGTNCGIFGGTTPYKLGGIPSVPTIYALTSPQGNTPTVNTVQINLSTRSNN